ncbi:hypothetical protein Busp01_11480 [Trinickia caryophylli]|nr:hypothetical protein Busp01_11480 [Trinickia caryophylli]
MKRVDHRPAVSAERWDEAATTEICERWFESQRRQPSVVGLSRLVALNFERARPDAIPPERRDQRLLPEGSSNDAYYQEMIVTFLKTMGLDNTDEVLDSFKKAGTGGLHRLPVSMSSTAGGALSVAQLAASAHTPTKTALSGITVLLTALTTRLAFTSAELRLRNAGTEEVMPLGRADAAPSAKVGPDIMRASMQLLWDLRKISKNVERMEQAQAELQDAKARLANPDAAPAERERATRDARAAGEKLSIAFARFCLRNELKADYKTAADSAKIEYHGNKRYLGVSVGTGALSATTTILGILTPVIVSTAVTTGVTAGAAVIAALLYVGYQLSPGPSKDGEAKAKRAIVALAKSLDLLAGNASSQQKARAEAYRTYVADKRASYKPEARARARQKLLVALAEIARNDRTDNDLDPLKNWLDYAAYRREAAQAGEDASALEAIEQRFVEAHANQFKPATASDGWKTPERMRFDNMSRLLIGKVSESIASLHTFNEKAKAAAPRDSRRESMARAQIHAGRRADIKASLRDWIHFELAQSRMKAALSEKDPEAARASLRAAGQALAAIENADARALFSTDGRKQVEATERAKRMTIGEAERYTMTNAGPAALAGLVNIGGATAGLGLNIEKAVKESHGIHLTPQYGDQNDARVLAQSSAPITAPYTAAQRARFQKTGMAKLVGTLARKGEPVIVKLDLPGTNPMLLDLGHRHVDAELDKLLADVEAMHDIPDEIALAVNGRKLTSGKLSGTTSNYEWRYRKASLGTRAKFQSQQLAMLANSVAVSVFPPIAQAAAQVPLSMTRRAADRGKAMSLRVRAQLTELSRDGSPAEATAPLASSPARHDGSPEQAQIPPSPAQVAQTPPVAADTAAPESAGRVPTAYEPAAAARALAVIPLLGGNERAELAPAPPAAVFRPRPAALAQPVGDAVRQQRMMQGEGAAETHRWFAANGIEAAYNSGGASMDCLIISLLQHATGCYEAEYEPRLAAAAAGYRAALVERYPEIAEGDQMLYDDEPAIAALLQTINGDYGVSMDLQLVLPTVDGPVRIQSAGTGTDRVGIVMFGNHYQALRHMGPTDTTSAARGEPGTSPEASAHPAPTRSNEPVSPIDPSATMPTPTRRDKVADSIERVRAWLDTVPNEPPTVLNREPVGRSEAIDTPAQRRAARKKGLFASSAMPASAAQSPQAVRPRSSRPSPSSLPVAAKKPAAGWPERLRRNAQALFRKTEKKSPPDA